jgi:glucose/arabinose dehydrogenase
MKPNGVATATLAAGLISTAAAATCSNVLTPSYQTPVVAAGWQAQLITSGLKKPRSIAWDSAGGLLVLDSGNGIVRYTFTDNGDTCLEVASQNVIVDSAKVSILTVSPFQPCYPSLTVTAAQPWSCPLH